MLHNYLVGTGGWAFFKILNKSSLKAYSELFNFVEVNYTFYEYPQFQLVERWRRTVPTDFTFSVKCHQDLTHRIGFVPTDQANEIFSKMQHYCKILNSPFLVLETPATYLINKENVKAAQDFFSSLNFQGLRLVWEYRAPINQTVIDLMQNFGIIHCCSECGQEREVPFKPYPNKPVHCRECWSKRRPYKTASIVKNEHLWAGRQK